MAGIKWLGTTAIIGASMVTGSCTVKLEIVALIFVCKFRLSFI
jgi:hypothetical protein